MKFKHLSREGRVIYSKQFIIGILDSIEKMLLIVMLIFLKLMLFNKVCLKLIFVVTIFPIVCKFVAVSTLWLSLIPINFLHMICHFSNAAWILIMS